jgi:hypothetical protein
MQFDLPLSLIGTGGIETMDLDHAAARPLGREAGPVKMLAEVIHERLVVKSNQHGPQKPPPRSSARRSLAIDPNEGENVPSR